MSTLQRKKILFIHETLNGGGAEKVFADVMSRFDFSRYDVSLLLLFAGGVHEENLPSQLTVMHLYGNQHSGLTKLRWHFRSSRNQMLRKDVRRLIGDEKYDVIISFLEGPALLAHSFILDRGKRNISWVHSDLEDNHWTKPFFTKDRETALYRAMDSVVFVSQSAKLAHERMFGKMSDARVILNIIEPELIRSRGSEQINLKREHKWVVCTVGRLCPEKRHDRLIDVIHILRTRYHLDIEVWVVGTGPDREKLLGLTAEYGLEDCVKFLGFQKNPYPYIKQSDLFLLTSDSEGFALVVAEALCLATPVVSTRGTGPEELLGADAGIVCDHDSEQLAKAVHDLLVSPAMIKQYAERSEARSAIFKPETTMQEIYSLIEN